MYICMYVYKMNINLQHIKVIQLTQTHNTQTQNRLRFEYFIYKYTFYNFKYTPIAMLETKRLITTYIPYIHSNIFTLYHKNLHSEWREFCFVFNINERWKDGLDFENLYNLSAKGIFFKVFFYIILKHEKSKRTWKQMI